MMQIPLPPSGIRRREYVRVFLVLLLCALFAVLLIRPEGGMVVTPDSDRFRDEAQSIVEGRGFSTLGQVETVLPPGYPVFLAIMISMNAERAVPWVQVVLFLAAILSVFLACTSRQSVPFAGLLTGLMAINLWVARACFYMLSEILGVFLCATLVFLAMRGFSGRRRATLVLAGALLVLLPLTSPAAQPLSFFIGVVLLLENRSARDLAWFLGGAALPFALWQWHCVANVGRMGIPLYTRNIAIRTEDPVVSWVRTWATSEADLWWIWHPDQGDSIPDRAFRSEEERNEILIALSHIGDGGVARREGELVLQRVTKDRERKEWFRSRILMPAIRAKSLWLHMPQLGHIQSEYVLRFGVGRFVQDRLELGTGRALARFLKGIASSVGYVIWVSIPVLFCVACFFPPQRRLMFAAIAAGILVYTAVLAYGAMGETRRNLVFYPVMLWAVASSRLFDTIRLRFDDALRSIKRIGRLEVGDQVIES